MSKKYQKKKRIFELFNENLKVLAQQNNWKILVQKDNRLDEIKDQVYICPLCIKPYFLKDIEGESSLLTLEHNPPKSLGGDEKLLTCKNCNNEAGSKLDHQLKRQMNILNFKEGINETEIETKFTIDNKKIKGSLVNKEDNKFYLQISQKSNPYYFNHITKYLKGEEGEVKFSFDISSPKLTNRALFKIAYLEMFYLFGYTFLFDKNIGKIRDYLNNKDSIIPMRILGDIPSPDCGINYIHTPNDFKCYLLVFKLSLNNNINTYGIPFPESGLNGWENYMRIIEAKEHTSFTYTHFTNYTGIQQNYYLINEYYFLPKQHLYF